MLSGIAGYSPVPNNWGGGWGGGVEGGFNKRRGPTDNLNINKRGVPNKRGCLKNVP